eukprot:3531671-Alexandrium_andersonii.AAC.1
MERAQRALAGSLQCLLERSRFAQHGAPLELTSEQLHLFRSPLPASTKRKLAEPAKAYMQQQANTQGDANRNNFHKLLAKSSEFKKP